MIKKNILAGLLLASSMLAGCTTISNSPGVTQTADNGEYLSIVNKTSFFAGQILSNRNVIVRCNAKTDKCESLNLWTKDGERIF